MGSAYTEDAYKDLIYTHPDWQKTADEYEQRFAANLYKTDYVQAAARTALLKLSGMLMAYYGVKAKKDRLLTDETAALADIAESISGQKLEGREVLEEALLPQSDSSTGAGQIGNERLSADPQSQPEMDLASIRNQANINDVMNRDGNLREQMTMLYNGMFINGGRDKEQIAASHSLKNMLLNITEEDLGHMRMAGAMAGDRNVTSGVVRFDLLKEMGQYKSKEDLFDTYSMARDLKRGNDKLKGRGNAVSRWWNFMKRGFRAGLTLFFGKSERSSEERKGLGLAHYENLGLPLSKRERANAVENGQLKWLEGQAYYKMKTPVTAEGLLQTAGPSGTTIRMLGAYKLLGAGKMDLLYFRLALIAWMVTSKDHSLYEILKGSHLAGVVGKEDLSEAATMYQSVDPIPREELREKLAPDHRFPHETIYMKLLNELRDKRRENGNGWNNSLFQFTSRLNRNGNKIKDASNAFQYSATELAVNIYTTNLYKVMNPAQKYGSFAGRYMLKHGDMDNITDEDRNDSTVMEGIYNLARLSAKFAQDGLNEMGSKESQRQTVDIYDGTRARMDEAYAKSFEGETAYRGVVYRGGRLTSELKSRGEFTFKSLTSTSLDYSEAETFYDEAPEDNRIMIQIRLNGKGAVNVTNMSKYNSENEILIPAGARFRITKKPQTAYYNYHDNTFIFESDSTEAPERLRRDFCRYRMMEIEEVSGPGEDYRRRMLKRDRKSMETRNQLLQARRGAQAQ